uniref:Candidate secreted effector n=1 Tax=Meloidogyne incognita TaxID=6306 RepID=A0A914M8A3_MELIC
MDNLTNIIVNQSFINDYKEMGMMELFSQNDTNKTEDNLNNNLEEMDNEDLDNSTQPNNSTQLYSTITTFLPTKEDSDKQQESTPTLSTFLDANTTTETIPTNISYSSSLLLENSTNVVEVEYNGCDCPMIDTNDFEIGAIIGAIMAGGIFFVIMLLRICLKKRQEVGPGIRCFFCL